MKVLVIEDDAETAAYIANGLSENGHVVDRASNGREGLFLAGGGAYDVAIVDRMLPGLDGLSLVKDLRGDGIRTAVLFLTNLGGIDDRVEGLDAGATIILSNLSPFRSFWLASTRSAVVLSSVPLRRCCGLPISKWTC